MNRLCYGDCLLVMQAMEAGSVDLIYLDPPFNSNKDYMTIYKDETGRPLPSQVEAFSDIWELNEERLRAVKELPLLMEQEGLRSKAGQFWIKWSEALRLIDPKTLAYLSYMAERLLLMHRVLRTGGQIYLHCDQTASHYLKILMDLIFGRKNFRREIIWDLRTASGFKSKVRGWIRGHDVILYYVKGGIAKTGFVFTKEYDPYTEEYINKYFYREDEKGKYQPRKGGRKQYLKDGKGIAKTDVWSDIDPFQQRSTSPENLGYATQKPVKLIKRIIRASSREGDLFFDPFCGCASSIEAAHKLGRRWIGVDLAIHAIKRVAGRRLRDNMGLEAGKDFEIDGVPNDFEGAQSLWEKDKYQFQRWAVEQVEGFATRKRTADGGVDGRIYFDVPGEESLQSMAIEVKGGASINPAVVRALRGVLEKDEAVMAGLIHMEDLGPVKRRNLLNEIADARYFTVDGKDYPRMQLLSTKEILGGKRFDTPPVKGRESPTPVLTGLDSK